MPRIASAKSSSAPKPIVHAPVSPSFPQSLQTTMIPVVQRPTLGQSIKDGFGLGLGASVARNLVDNWFQKPVPSQPVQTTPVSSGTSVATEYQKKEYIQCMQTIKDHEHCKKLIENNNA